MRNEGPSGGEPTYEYGLTPATVDLVGLLRLRAERLGRQRAFTFLADGDAQREHLTYAQLDARARAIAAHLQSRGLAGERALLLYPSGLEFLAAFFGCLYAGVVAVPAYPPRRNRNMRRIQSIVDDAAPKIALTTEDVFARIEPVLGEMPDLAAVAWKCTRDIDTASGEAWRDPGVTPNTLAFLQYTSGSTGAPKGVMLSHGNLLHNTTVISAAFRPSYASCGVTWLPLYHDMGLIGGVIQPIYFGRPTTVMTPTHFLQKPLRWLRAISDTGALISGGPNFAYELCVERVTEEEKKTLDLSQWELAFNGAEPVRAETIERFCEAFAPCGFRREAFYPCYGLAEATLMVAGGDRTKYPTIRSFEAEALQHGRAVDAAAGAAAEGSAVQRLVGSGGPMQGQEVVIVDPETLGELPAGRVGEIWVRGPSVAQGYWNRPEESEGTFRARLADGRGPFLRTGDLGCVVESARGGAELFVNGRLKDLIIVRGVNHYPQDIELTAEQSHEDLPAAAGAAFAVDVDGAEQLVLVQEVGRKRSMDFEAACTAIRSSVARVHEVSPRAVVLIKANTIPKTSSGKIQRHACRDAYLRGELDVVAECGADGVVTVHARRRRGDADTPPDDRAAQAPQPAAAKSVVVEAPLAPDAVVERVLAVVRAVGKERTAQMDLDSDIAGLGLDSLERMEIVALLEQEFGGRFSEEAILSMETCRDVVHQVRLCLVGKQNSERDKAAGEPLEADYVFSKSPEYRRLADTIRRTAEAGLRNPYFTRHEGVLGDTTIIGGAKFVNFCSYNYLGMSGEPAVTDAAQLACEQFGTSTSASRLVSGERTIHRDLERAIAELNGADDSMVFPSGHQTNETVIGHLFGPGDLILHDALAHNSIIQGCKLAGSLRRAFPHNDWRACEELLARYRREHRRVLVVIEGVYSMDGDYCDLPRFVEVKNRHKAYLMIDEAHSIGTMGATGRGMSEFQGVAARDVDIWMGTISKALGSCGGYVAGSSELIEYLKYTTPGFVFSCGIAPGAVAAALAAIRLLDAEPERVTRLHENAALFLRLAKEAGFHTGGSGGTPIVPVILGDSALSMRMSQAMFDLGVNVQPIVHPAVEESAARLRFFVTSQHTEAQIRRSVSLLSEAWRTIRSSLPTGGGPAAPFGGAGAIMQAAGGEAPRGRTADGAAAVV